MDQDRDDQKSGRPVQLDKDKPEQHGGDQHEQGGQPQHGGEHQQGGQQQPGRSMSEKTK